jgi:hypothetical protein
MRKNDGANRTVRRRTNELDFKYRTERWPASRPESEFHHAGALELYLRYPLSRANATRQSENDD